MARTSLIFAILLFFVISPVALVGRKNASVNNYVVMIADIYNYYKSSCVVFLQSGSYNDLRATYLMHSWHLEFSQRGIFSLAITFSDSVNETEKYYNHIRRPLFVVLLDTKESMDEFAKLTKYIRISFPVWLVLFMEQPGRPLKEFCQRPKGNLFNLVFNTEMLILCYDHPVVKEWYSLRDNHTKVSNLATWSLEKGFVPFTMESLYARRGDMFGETMRVATVADSPFVTLDNGVLTGFIGGLVMELSAVMNFTIDFLGPTEEYGNWHNEEQAWTGVIGQLVTGQVDLGIAEFSVTNHRRQAVDFTIPLLLTRNRIYLKQPDGSSVVWSQYFKAFDAGTWAAVIGLITTAPILLTVIKTRGSLAARILTQNYMHVWGIYCQQGLSDFPEESSLRLAFFSIFISALIVSSAYSASLISFITVATGSLPFNTLEGFADDGTYELTVFKNTADYDLFVHTQDSLFLRMKKLMKSDEKLPLTLTEGFSQVCTDQVGFYTIEELKSAINPLLSCKIAYIETGKVESLAMALSKDNPYKDLINYHLQRFHDHGILNRLRVESNFKPSPLESEHDAVSIWGVAPILAILAGGIILAGILLLLEKLHFLKYSETHAIQPLLQRILAIWVTSSSSIPAAPVAGNTLKNRDTLIVESSIKKLRSEYRP